MDNRLNDRRGFLNIEVLQWSVVNCLRTDQVSKRWTRVLYSPGDSHQYLRTRINRGFHTYGNLSFFDMKMASGCFRAGVSLLSLAGICIFRFVKRDGTRSFVKVRVPRRGLDKWMNHHCSGLRKVLYWRQNSSIFPAPALFYPNTPQLAAGIRKAILC